MHIELLKVYPNLLNAHSKYGGSCSIYIMKAHCVALGAYMIKWSSSRYILNAHWAMFGTFWLHKKQTLCASMMLLEQQKMRQTGNQPIRLASPHRASSKHIQNKKDNLNEFKA